MTWFAWRQFRTSAIVAACLLVAGAVLYGATAPIVTSQWTDSGAAACQTDCRRTFQTFLDDVFSNIDGSLYMAGRLLVYLVPALVGAFWGAPLIARELETGTHRLAWNQSVTRTRWLATKLAIAGVTTAASVGLASWGVGAWSRHIDDSMGERITPSVFAARGIVPVGYALFALALGVTFGMLIRRTVPAMAATLGIYVAAVVAMPLWIRGHLIAPVHTMSPLDLDSIDHLAIRRPGLAMEVVSGVVPQGAWVLSNTTITPTGAPFTGPADLRYCGGGQSPETCANWLGTLGLRQDLIYHPASQFWPLQWAETGIFVALAAALVAFCFWWTRHRLS